MQSGNVLIGGNKGVIHKEGHNIKLLLEIRKNVLAKGLIQVVGTENEKSNAQVA